MAATEPLHAHGPPQHLALNPAGTSLKGGVVAEGVFHEKVGVKGWAGHPGTKTEWLRTLELRPIDEPLGK